MYQTTIKAMKKEHKRIMLILLIAIIISYLVLMAAFITIIKTANHPNIEKSFDLITTKVKYV